MKRIVHHRGPGFTLIELLIVVGIIGIMMGSTYALLTHLGETRLRIEARLDAQQDAQQTLERWRADVALATRTERDAAGDVLTLWLAAPGGGESAVRYECTADHAIVRRVDAPGAALPETLARGVSEAAFEPVGRGWRLHWTHVFDDGAIRLRWTFAGCATPLLTPGGAS